MRFAYLGLAIISFLEVVISAFFFVMLWIINKLNFQKEHVKKNSTLLIRLDHKIGDMVIFSDFLKKYREINNSSYITLIAHISQKELYEHCPFVDRIVYFSWGRNLSLSLPFRSARVFLFFLKNKLNQKRWDIAISSRYDEDFYAPIFIFYSMAKTRIGFTSFINSRKRYSQFLTDIFYSLVIKDRPLMHEARSNLIVFEALKLKRPEHTEIFYETWQSSSQQDSTKVLLSSFNIAQNDRLIALGIGAYAKKRIWPPGHYSELIRLIASSSDLPYTFVLLGSKDDIPLGEGIVCSLKGLGNSRVINLTGLSTIQESCAILRRADIFIGSDSGLMHLACANVDRVIEISCHPVGGDKAHPNSPIRFGPITRQSVVLQPMNSLSPCIEYCSSNQSHCITNIKPNDVFSKYLTLMDPSSQQVDFCDIQPEILNKCTKKNEKSN